MRSLSMVRRLASLLLVTLAITAVAACGTESTPAGAPTGTTGPTTLWDEFADIPAIASTTMEWPRTVEGANGAITIGEPPQRIHTLSLGHDEMIVALVGAGRFAGIGTSTANPDYSNIAGQVQGVPQVGRDAEQVIALAPDIVIASKFTKQDLIDLITSAGIPVFRSDLESSAAGNIPNILTLGYMLGAEERAVQLVQEIRDRLAFVAERVPSSGEERVRVVSMARFHVLRVGGRDNPGPAGKPRGFTRILGPR